MNWENIGPVLFAIILIVIIILIFDRQIFYLVSAVKSTVISVITGESPWKTHNNMMDDDDDSDSNIERLNDPKVTTMNPPQEVADTLMALGYTSDAPWDEVLQATELEPSTFVNHMDFVKDVRRFSSGANFTAVADDDNSPTFTNFRGLIRPQAPKNMIGESARQVPSEDETVLTRNRGMRW
jgi:hypothetical protein